MHIITVTTAPLCYNPSVVSAFDLSRKEGIYAEVNFLSTTFSSVVGKQKKRGEDGRQAAHAHNFAKPAGESCPSLQQNEEEKEFSADFFFVKRIFLLN